MLAERNLKNSEMRILVTGGIDSELKTICRLLELEGYCCMGTSSLQRLEEALEEFSVMAVLLDLDTIPVTNRIIRKLTEKNPGLNLLCTSSNRFHPELRDAISYYIFACLTKPVDPDELLYWLKCIGENETGPRASP